MKKIAAIALIVVMVSIGSAVWPFPDSSRTYSGTPLSITIGEKPYEANALFYIAEDQGFFARNGLNVTTRIYNSVPEALNGLLNDEVDMGLASEYAIVGKLLNKENIYIIGSIDRFQSLFLIGRKDKGITNISDLKGKKIGLTRDAIGEFYLGRFLDLHGMSVQDVTLVNTPPLHQVQALTNGSVDALVAGTYIDIIKERFGSNVVSWPVQNSQEGYLTISCRGDWAASHPEQINRLLKSLVQAEEYVTDHPDQARAIVQKRLNYSDEYMDTVWPEHQFYVTLDQSLLIAMNDEGRWMINNNLTSEKTMPYFKDYMYTNGLEEVKPEAVNIR